MVAIKSLDKSDTGLTAHLKKFNVFYHKRKVGTMVLYNKYITGFEYEADWLRENSNKIDKGERFKFCVKSKKLYKIYE